MQAGHRADIDVMRGQLSRAEARLSQNEAKLNQTEATLNQKLDQAEAKLDESKVARRSVSRVLSHVALNHLWCAGPGSDAHRRAQAEARAELEQARLCVDRIAFCGQVPCNVAGDFEVGDYIVAAASGAGIKAVAVKLDDMTLAQYARRIGKVWAIRDGRAWIDVQHG